VDPRGRLETRCRDWPFDPSRLTRKKRVVGRARKMSFKVPAIWRRSNGSGVHVSGLQRCEYLSSVQPRAPGRNRTSPYGTCLVAPAHGLEHTIRVSRNPSRLGEGHTFRHMALLSVFSVIQGPPSTPDTPPHGGVPVPSRGLPATRCGTAHPTNPHPPPTTPHLHHQQPCSASRRGTGSLSRTGPSGQR
jgi:hypothetical protein